MTAHTPAQAGTLLTDEWITEFYAAQVWKHPTPTPRETARAIEAAVLAKLSQAQPEAQPAPAAPALPDLSVPLRCDACGKTYECKAKPPCPKAGQEGGK